MKKARVNIIQGVDMVREEEDMREDKGSKIMLLKEVIIEEEGTKEEDILE